MVRFRKVGSGGWYVAQHAGMRAEVQKSHRSGLWITLYNVAAGGPMIFGPAFTKLADAKQWALGKIR